MVWSSAQPHSVDDMVGKAFGEKKGELKAVWARDTLGLSEHQYRMSTPNSPEPVPSCPSTSTPRAEAHSALTTVLLDDSPLKAHLQPYNHVCIKEYDSPLRRSDLDILEAQRAKQRQEELDADPDTSAEGKVYDQTLLAIIGILDETRVQSNVAGWIRGGGLWGPKRDEIKTYQAQDREVPAALTSESSESMWFEDEETVRYWAGKGREALERLGIPVEDGIEG
ncbi:hypothetical protein OE88DRAFT_1638491 [Heliocybe sulcata]|uniref:FCP1 homology domain-containing protein n=1 Tax=Heliocybe sulcata TaxID=5364 RepID=A0A5C3MNH5_9AGAM|nr:hypothetical protein OE88DRAFT_1638491 [Heliocybe sulcata]